MGCIRLARAFIAMTIFAASLSACVPLPPAAPPPVTRMTAMPAEGIPPASPKAVEYNLGETTITQARFPEDSRFRNMPVRLNGVIAAPDEGTGPFPVVVILHGTHPGCPEDEMGIDRWPCDPEVERSNYRGFGYLVSALAAQGYVALAPNINAENTFGFGEPTPAERLKQLLDLHLQALATATAGGANDFGVDLTGAADLNRLALVGHSRGGEAAVALARGPATTDASQPSSSWARPVAGILQIAPAAVTVDPWPGVDVPLATILAACDGDVQTQDGQFFFEGVRLAQPAQAWATTAWLERANHNAFNTILPGDPFSLRGRPDCETLLEPEAQRAWLVAYAGDFLTALFGQDPAAVAEARARMGIDERLAAPDALYGQAALVASLAPAANRQTVLIPAAAEELTAHLLGGPVTAEGVATHFCPKGFYSASSLPGSEPCRRNYVTIPGQPSHAVVSWEGPGAALRFVLPEGAGDLSGYTALSLRAAIDPASPRNAVDSPQAFSVQLTDRAGNRATAQTRPGEPALGFPPGTMQVDSVMPTGFFTGLVPLTTIRLALRDFAGIDLANIGEIALLFDQRPSGSLFVGDLEWVR